MAVANTAADNPFGLNPFDKTDSRFQLWQDAERDARERLASFQADHWRQMPPQSAPPESFIKYKVAWVVGIFDAWAGPYCAMAAWNNNAEFHEDIFDGVIGSFAERLIKQVTPLGPSAVQIRAQALVSETRIALLQRRAHWKAEGFRTARQVREASADAQVLHSLFNILETSPVSAGNGMLAAATSAATVRGAEPKRPPGPLADEEGDRRVAEILPDGWERDLPNALDLLASPPDGKAPVTPTRPWQSKHGVTTYPEAVPLGNKLTDNAIQKHISRRRKRGLKLLHSSPKTRATNN